MDDYMVHGSVFPLLNEVSVQVRKALELDTSESLSWSVDRTTKHKSSSGSSWQHQLPAAGDNSQRGKVSSGGCHP